MTSFPNQLPVKNPTDLIDRVYRFFQGSNKKIKREEVSAQQQLDLSSPTCTNFNDDFGIPCQEIKAFLDFASASMPDGGIYLFGGVMRDLAVFGKKGPNADIDIVVEGDWTLLRHYLISNNAQLNKFGGFRIHIGNWPVDIWHAKDTWAIENGLVEYKGIASLIHTTILNWDGILYNWGTKKVICSDRYFDDINERAIDIVLEKNPNPLGMAVRVFRHLWLKDPKKISHKTVNYLHGAANTYSIEDLRHSEIVSYGDSFLQDKAYHFFKKLKGKNQPELVVEFSGLREIMSYQLELY